ncbi:MAG: hypothetical protein AAB592_05160 [Patescibacteria group bacterium]
MKPLFNTYDMARKIHANNRDIMRSWPALRDKLKSGTVDSVEISSSGDVFVIRLQKKKREPGDLTELTEKIKSGKVRYKLYRPDIDWSFKSLKTL